MDMSSEPQKQGAGTNYINPTAQVAVTHNPLFPFSSPDIDNRSSFISDRTRFTSEPQTTPAPDQSNHYVDNHSKAAFQQGQLQPGYRVKEGTSYTKPTSVKNDPKKSTRVRSRPGLHIDTDFSQSRSRTADFAINQVVAKRPEHSQGRVRSVVSQVGIKGLPSPLTASDPAQVISNLRNLINATHEKRLGITGKKTKVPDFTQAVSSPTRSSVVFGLSIPKHEAAWHRHDDNIQSAVTLVTPATPRTIVTPAHEKREPPIVIEKLGAINKGRRIASPTSVYSKSVSQYYPPRSAQVYTLPQQPADQAASNPYTKRRASSESQQQILPESCDTARPKSQGWWNLVISPILSRAGTWKSQRVVVTDDVPPVPPIPTMDEKQPPAQTPMTNISPETPRRLGLVNVRASTWSEWTEWKHDRDSPDENAEDIHEPVPTIPLDYLANGNMPGSSISNIQTHKDEGLAAEYYHACAVEQLANITYFECINHSCLEHLPKLRSIYDGQEISTGDMLPRKMMETSPVVKGLALVPQAHVNKTRLPAHGTLNLFDSNDLGSVKPPRQQCHSRESSADNEGDLGELVSPNIREARTAAFSRARTVNSRESSPAPHPPIITPPKEQVRTSPLASEYTQPSIESPGPISPDAARAIAPTGAMSMAPIQSRPADTTVTLVAPVPQIGHTLLHQYQPPSTVVYYPYEQTATSHSADRTQMQVPANYWAPPSVVDETHEVGGSARGISSPVAEGRKDSSHAVVETKKRERKSTKKDKQTKSGFLGILCCFSRSKTESKAQTSRKQMAVLTGLLLFLTVLCILFAILFTRGHGEANPIASQWLNLTGYPPMPTGISTIARPNLVASQNQCTAPSTLWSCSLPKEDQVSVVPNDPDQPNFRFQIRFLNGSVPANLTIPLSERDSGSSADDLFVPNPSPPGQLDQIFLGNTTDNVSQPFDGESTPFFITFMSPISGQSSATNSSRRLLVRQSGGNDPLNSIPPPSLAVDGSAAPASLLPTTPFPISQPIKLYNRGLRDEHYGFYMYYDKSVFLSAFSILNGTAISNNQSSNTADQNGGCAEQNATLRCTWSQTRFIVKIYTNPVFGASLLSGITTNTTSSKQDKNTTSSATDFNRPGSFPYPTSILLDRHGGDINKKLLYCYGMDDENILPDEKILVSESRSFGGVLVNPAPNLFTSGNSSFNPNLGGIDGGTGGCGCTWQNWS